MHLLRPITLLCWLLLHMPALQAQATDAVADTLDQVDEQGRKQGHWRITAPQPGKPGYADGALVEEGRYTNSRRTGLWKRYWPNGQVMSEIHYQAGRPKGPYRTFYPDGKTEEEGSWDLDRNTGSFKRWHPNGKLAQEFAFDEHGVRQGLQKYYHENGRLAVELTVRDGREEGTLKRYLPNGELQQVAEFNNGVMDETRSLYIKSAPTAEDVKPAADAPQAPTVTREESTNVAVFRENGFNTLYDQQLRLSKVGEFKNGRLWEGRQYRYDKDGLLLRIEMYRHGRYIGNAVITEDDQ